MRRLIVIIYLTLMLVSMVLPVHAEDAVQTEESLTIEDSLTLSEDELSSLPINCNNPIIRVYKVNDFSIAFTQYSNIDEVLTHASEFYIHSYYVVKETEETSALYWYVQGKLNSHKSSANWYTELMDLHLSGKAKAIICEISPDIVVENVYFLRDSSAAMIYYKTNLGEYVYVSFDEIHYPAGVDKVQTFTGDYLLSLPRFLELMKAIRHHLEKSSTSSVQYIGHSSLFNIADAGVDLSPYDISSPNFDPNAPFPTTQENTDDANFPWLTVGICGGVCVIAGATAFLIVRKKKTNAMI